MTDSVPETVVVAEVAPERAATRRPSFSVRFSDALSRLLVQLKVEEIPHIKRIVVTVVGGTFIVFGFALVWTPVPAGLLVPLGFAVLGTEYAWARRWMRKARLMAGKALVKTQQIIGREKAQ